MLHLVNQVLLHHNYLEEAVPTLSLLSLVEVRLHNQCLNLQVAFLEIKNLMGILQVYLAGPQQLSQLTNQHQEEVCLEVKELEYQLQLLVEDYLDLIHKVPHKLECLARQKLLKHRSSLLVLVQKLVF